MEKWKDIIGYEGHYQVSNHGRVCSVKHGERKFLKPNDAKKGYLQVTLYKDGERRSHNIHRLVAVAFVPNPENLPEVNHIDENTYNNSYVNLEWCTAKYNSNYGTRGARISTKITGIGGTPVIAIKDGHVIEFPSVCNAAKYFGVTHAPVQRCVRMNNENPVHTIKGYIIKLKG